MYSKEEIYILFLLLVTVVYMLFFSKQKSMEKLIKYEYINHYI